MKVVSKLLVLVVITALTLCSCGSAPKSLDAAGEVLAEFHEFSEITGIDWMLAMVKTESQNKMVNRESSDLKRFDAIFTLRFDAEMVSGVGAPNRFSAPYTAGDNQEISVKLVRSTLMAPLFEPEILKEHEYFNYLQNAYKWNLSGERMELYTKNADGAGIILVFSQNNN